MKIELIGNIEQFIFASAQKKCVSSEGVNPDEGTREICME